MQEASTLKFRPLSQCCKIDIKIEEDKIDEINSDKDQEKKLFADNLLKNLLNPWRRKHG